jgi:hypothetical protein
VSDDEDGARERERDADRKAVSRPCRVSIGCHVSQYQQGRERGKKKSAARSPVRVEALSTMSEIRRPMLVDACGSTPPVITAIVDDRSILLRVPPSPPPPPPQLLSPSFSPPSLVVIFPAVFSTSLRPLPAPLRCAGTGRIKSPDAGHSRGRRRGDGRENGGEGRKKCCNRVHVATGQLSG